VVCVAATARSSASANSDDRQILIETRKNCDFIAQEVVSRLRDPNDNVGPEDWKREFGLKLANSDQQNLSNLRAAGNARAVKIAAMVRSENGKHNAEN
jgi:hypothetical protein